MAIRIQSGKNNLDRKLNDSRVQSMPFKVLADCDAPVEKLFDNFVESKENDVLEVSFRGCPLQGKKIELPEGYTGVVLHESLKPMTDKEERKFYVVNKFREVVYWNFDTVPSKNDAFMQALDWIDIAEGLHSPITEE